MASQLKMDLLQIFFPTVRNINVANANHAFATVKSGRSESSKLEVGFGFYWLEIMLALKFLLFVAFKRMTITSINGAKLGTTKMRLAGRGVRFHFLNGTESLD